MAKKNTETTKIVCKNVHHHGKKMNLPNVGEVEVTKDGEVEVDEETAELLVTKTNDWKYADEKAPSKKAKNDEEEEETEEEEKEETEEEEEEETEDAEVKGLDQKLTKHMAKTMDLPALKAMVDGKMEASAIKSWKNKGEAIKAIIASLSVEDKKDIAKQI